MRGSVVWTIAGPMLGLGVLFIGLGAFSAWNVHERQRRNSDMVAREVHSLVAISELHITMREIRYQVNLFLRTQKRSHLDAVATLDADARRELTRAAKLIRDEPEHLLIDEVGRSYAAFSSGFGTIVAALPPEGTEDAVAVTPDVVAGLTGLSDDLLTNDVLRPLHESLEINQQVVERMDEASRASARLLTIGLLLLGACGGLAGLLMGTAIARTIGRSLVQLTVTVRDAAGRLAEAGPAVTISPDGDLAGLASRLREMERGITDVVERLRRSETELLRREQLARVGQLAAGLAHELRNPLTPMKMLVQAAIERGPDAGLNGRSLQVLEHEIGRMETAIQAFLDFARPPRPEKTAVDLRDVVTPTLDLIAERASRQNVEVRAVLPGEPLVTRVDRGQIRQLLLNVLLNAIDAMPAGGRVEVSLEAQAGSPGGASATGPGAPAEWIALRVADGGAGIPEDILPRLFEPFVTTKESGTGLGLPICGRIAAAHGGRISARNRAGGGAEVELLLPRTMEA